MLPKSLNPYPSFGQAIKDGLDAIIAALPVTPTTEDLVNEVYNYVSTNVYIPVSGNKLEIKSVSYSAVDSYINGPIGNYSPVQLKYIHLLTGSSITTDNTVDGVGDRITDVEDLIIKSGIAVGLQNPLLMGTMAGSTIYDYFLNEIGLGVGSAWNTYLSGALSSAYANLPYWTSAGIIGTLIGARSTNVGMLPPTSEIVSTQLLSALTGALTISAGKIIFKWTPKIAASTSNDSDFGGNSYFDLSNSSISKESIINYTKNMLKYAFGQTTSSSFTNGQFVQYLDNYISNNPFPGKGKIGSIAATLISIHGSSFYEQWASKSFPTTRRPDEMDDCINAELDRIFAHPISAIFFMAGLPWTWLQVLAECIWTVYFGA